jgi:FkbM family methyltransferase
MISYSINHEDVMLNRAFQDIKDGTYIDVGAFLPVQHSNTYALYARGWSGVVCDPVFNFEIDWVQQWCALRPRDKVVRDAIGAAPGETEFWLCNYRGLSTCARQSIDRHLDQSPTNTAMSDGSKVPMSTLDQVIGRLMDGKAPHLISIDVEGLEGEVLKGIDLTKHRPWMFVIESYNSADLSPHYPAWEPLLSDAGYQCVWDDRINRFYVADERMELAKHFDYPPNVTDAFMPVRQYDLQRRLEEYESNRSTLMSRS